MNDNVFEVVLECIPENEVEDRKFMEKVIADIRNGVVFSNSKIEEIVDFVYGYRNYSGYVAKIGEMTNIGIRKRVQSDIEVMQRDMKGEALGENQGSQDNFLSDDSMEIHKVAMKIVDFEDEVKKYFEELINEDGLSDEVKNQRVQANVNEEERVKYLENEINHLRASKQIDVEGNRNLVIEALRKIDGEMDFYEMSDKEISEYITQYDLGTKVVTQQLADIENAQGNLNENEALGNQKKALLEKKKQFEAIDKKIESFRGIVDKIRNQKDYFDVYNRYNELVNEISDKVIKHMRDQKVTDAQMEEPGFVDSVIKGYLRNESNGFNENNFQFIDEIDALNKDKDIDCKKMKQELMDDIRKKVLATKKRKGNDSRLKWLKKLAIGGLGLGLGVTLSVVANSSVGASIVVTGARVLVPKLVRSKAVQNSSVVKSIKKGTSKFMEKHPKIHRFVNGVRKAITKDDVRCFANGFVAGYVGGTIANRLGVFDKVQDFFHGDTSSAVVDTQKVGTSTTSNNTGDTYRDIHEKRLSDLDARGTNGVKSYQQIHDERLETFDTRDTGVAKAYDQGIDVVAGDGSRYDLTGMDKGFRTASDAIRGKNSVSLLNESHGSGVTIEDFVLKNGERVTGDLVEVMDKYNVSSKDIAAITRSADGDLYAWENVADLVKEVSKSRSR